MLHPNHFSDLLLLRHVKRNQANKTRNYVATIMRDGLTDYHCSHRLKALKPHNNSVHLLDSVLKVSSTEQSSELLHNIEDIFKPPRKDDKKPSFILIEGAPGIGKTTLCKHIAYQWAEGKLLNDSEIVLLVDLCNPDILRISDIKDLFHYFYNFDKAGSRISEQCADMLCYTEIKHNITIILDSYDEFHDVNGNSLITKLVKRSKILPHSTLIVAVRPISTDKLYCDSRVEILGFTEESKMQYIKKELQDYETIAALCSYLETHPFVKSACYIPIMMSILVYIFQENEDLPCDPTKWFEKLVSLTISHYLLRLNKDSKLFSSLHMLPLKFKTSFLDISKFAYLSLSSDKITFCEKDVKNVCPDSLFVSDNVQGLGLVKFARYFSTENTDNYIFNFMHLSVQEYLAAYYVSSLDQGKQFIELGKTFFVRKYVQSWFMFASINKTSLSFGDYQTFSNRIDDSTLTTWINNSTGICSLRSFFELYKVLESSMQMLCFKTNHDLPCNGTESRELSNWDQMYFSLCNFNKRDIIVEIFVLGKSVYDEWLNFMHQILQHLNFGLLLANYYTLILCRANKQQIINVFNVHKTFSTIALQDCYLDNDDINHLSLCIEYSEYINIVNCNFENSGILKISNSLQKKSKLLQLVFYKNKNFIEDFPDVLASILLCNTSLQDLQVVNSRGQISANKIICALFNVSTLKVLRLCNYSISPDAAKALANVILYNSSLEILDLANNNLGNCATMILKQVSKLKTLKVLDIENNGIPMEAAEALKSVILSNSKLEQVYLDNNNLQEGITEVAMALHNAVALKAISISNNGITSGAIKTLSSAFLKTNLLEVVKLAHNNLKSSACCILSSLAEISNLKVLDIRGNHIPREAADDLAFAVSSNTGLQQLYIDQNNLEMDSSKVIDVLKHISSLKVLGLGTSIFPNKIAYKLAAVIKSNNGLEKLLLNDSNLYSSSVVVLQSLRNVLTLTILDLSNNHIGEEASKVLSLVISHNKGLKELYLGGNNFQHGIVDILQALQHSTSLKVLDLSNNYLPSEVGCKIAAVINANKYLEKLYLQNNFLLSSMICILESLLTVSSLKVLNIKNNCVTESAVDALASLISRSNTLEGLFLSGNTFQGGMLKAINALQSISSLTSISLENGCLPKSLTTDFATAIANNVFLERLCVKSNNLKNSVVSILHAIRNITTLKVLDISTNQVTSQAVDNLELVLKNNHLEELYLENNCLQDDIGLALQNIVTLKILTLSNNGIPSHSAKALANAIQLNKNLRIVKLAHNRFGTSSISIMHALEALSNLEILDFESNQIPKEVVDILVSVIRKNFGLRELYLGNTNLHSKVLNVADALQYISSLKVLDLSNNSIPSHAANYLSRAIESNSHLEKLILHSNGKLPMDAILQSLSTNLKFLDLHNNNMSEPQLAIDNLTSVIENNNLETLLISNTNLQGNAKNVAIALQKTSSLKYLDLSCNNIEDNIGNELVAAIRVNSTLKSICLSGNNFKFSAVSVLQSLSSIFTLTELRFENIQITRDAGPALACVIQNNQRLEEVTLNENNLGDAVVDIAVSLKSSIFLRVLGLNSNGLSKEVAPHLAAAIYSKNCLEELHLHNNNMQEALNVILEALTSISTLRLLDIQGNQMTEEAGDILEKVILANTELEELLFGNNYLGKGAVKVVQALQNITQVKVLDLSNNNLPSEVSGELANAIRSNCSLENLSLHSNNLQSSCISILQALQHIITLKSLDISNNQISKKAGSFLASVILNNNLIEELHLSNNNLQTGGNEIVKALSYMSSIKVIDLSFNNLPHNITIELAATIDSNSMLKILYINNNWLTLRCNILKKLSNLANLMVLDIHGCQIFKEDTDILASIISNSNILQALCVNNLPDEKALKALCNISSLKVLVIDTVNESNIVDKDVATIINNNQYLQWLSLSNVKLHTNKIFKALHLPYLVFLYLENNFLSEETSGDIELALKPIKTLKKVVLLDNMLQAGLIQIAKVCNNLSVDHLNLAYNCISPNKINDLASTIKSNNSIKKLILGGIALNVRDSFYVSICETIALSVNEKVSKNQDLLNNDHEMLEFTYLEVSRRQISNFTKNFDDYNPFYRNVMNLDFAVKLEQYISNEVNCEQCIKEAEATLKQVDATKLASLNVIQSITVLDLERNNVNEGSAIQLSHTLQYNSTLEQLWLRGNKLSIKGTTCILNSLKCTSLSVLDLSFNNIGIDSASSLAAVIHCNPLLEKLWIDGNDLQTEGAITISSTLKLLSTLKILSLCSNRITTCAAESLSAVISHNLLLEDLLLGNNQLYSEGINIITKSLYFLKKLRKIDFSNTFIDKYAAHTLSLVISNSCTLQELYLSKNNLENAGVKEICIALKCISTLKVLALSNNNITTKIANLVCDVLLNNQLCALLIASNALTHGIIEIAQTVEKTNACIHLLSLSNNNARKEDKDRINKMLSERQFLVLHI